MKAKTSSELKRSARGLLLGKYSIAISVFMSTQLIITILTLLTRVSTSNGSMASLLMQIIITFIISLFSGILGMGINAFYLNVACNRPYSISDIFIGFKTCPDKAIGIQFFILLFSYLALSPFYVSYFLLTTPLSLGLPFGQSDNPGTSLARITVLILFTILGLSLYLWVTLIYSHSFRLLLDFPDRSIGEILGMSYKLMKGHKLRLLYILFSFIPLILVGLISFGIGLLFVIPYINMTNTLFYLDLLNNKASQGRGSEHASLQSAPHIDCRV